MVHGVALRCIFEPFVFIYQHRNYTVVLGRIRGRKTWGCTAAHLDGSQRSLREIPVRFGVQSWSDVILVFFSTSSASGVIAASHILLRFCGVPKFKAGNTDVATTFEVCVV
jgi:hypothetical protein